MNSIAKFSLKSKLTLVSNAQKSTSQYLSTAASTDEVKWTMKRSKNAKPLVETLRARHNELEAKAKAMGLEWRVLGATALHRYPTLLPLAEPWEEEFLAIQDKIDDKKRKALFDNLQGTSSQLVSDEHPTYEDIMKTMPFTPASRTTEADLKNDIKSTYRKLDKSLYLIVKRNRSDNSWQFPQGKLLEGENLRKCCERVVDRAAIKTNRWFMSNSPMGYYCYEYPPEVQKARNQFGAKVYFMRTQLLDEAPIKLEKRLYTDYAWISRAEVPQYFPAEMVDFIQAALPE